MNSHDIIYVMISRLPIVILAALFLPTMSLAQSASLLPIPSYQTINTAAAPSIDIDLIVEAETYVPYFYAGRREPIPGSTVHLNILPLGKTSPASYRWQIGNQNIITTQPTTTFTFPNLAREIQIIVTAVDQNGNAIGTVSETLRASTPQVNFYETNSLRGTANVAIPNELVLIGDEVGIKAEPYFFSGQSILSSAIGSWTTTGVNVITENDWRKISLVRQEDQARDMETSVRLDVRSYLNLSETVMGKFNLKI